MCDYTCSRVVMLHNDIAYWVSYGSCFFIIYLFYFNILLFSFSQVWVAATQYDQLPQSQVSHTEHRHHQTTGKSHNGVCEKPSCKQGHSLHVKIKRKITYLRHKQAVSERDVFAWSWVMCVHVSHVMLSLHIQWFWDAEMPVKEDPGFLCDRW